MKLKWLKLQHFRNYDDLELQLDAPLTALVGLNAQGKTNLLESIAFLTLGKSFRAGKALETLKWDRPHGRIRACIERKGKEMQLEVFLQRSPEIKKVKKQSKWTTPKNFLGSLRAVLFTPDHLGLITGNPQARRQYLDRLLVQVDKDYIEALTNYQRILNHRNALLKRIQLGRAQEWELDLWDARLGEEALKIWKKREVFLDFLKHDLEKKYISIAGKGKQLTLQTHLNKDRFEERLIAHRSNDVQTGTTSLGPHRDDFTLFLDDKELSESGSRGEQRSAVLVLKIAELKYIEEQTGEKPLLLLDDVFSELDEKRQKKLGELLGHYQCILTTTSLDHVKGLKQAKVYWVKEGALQG
ncbi:MAG: DNA replication/repair protein RecF [Candidatus Gracilibacteria bacterium]